VAVARRLLELIWYILTRLHPYGHFNHEQIACKYPTWAWQTDEAARAGLTRQQFARYYLRRLSIGHDLTRIKTLLPIMSIHSLTSLFCQSGLTQR